MPRTTKAAFNNRDDERYRDVHKSWTKPGTTPPPSRGPTVDMLDHRSVKLTTRAMSAIFRCPWCSKIEMIPFIALGTNIETACRRGRVTVVARIAEHEEGARDAR